MGRRTLLVQSMALAALILLPPASALSPWAPPPGNGEVEPVGAAPVPSVYTDPASVAPKFWVEPEPRPAPATPPTTETRSFNGYAVLMAINDYPGNPLHGCISDITAIRDRLVNSYGWDSSNIHFVTDASVTPERIVQEIRWMASVADAGSQTVFSFSGHGSTGVIYAYPMNAVNDETVAAELKRLESRENICIFDSCRSGSCTEVNITSPPFISMMACAANELASDGETFTKAWVEGLGTTQWGNVEEAYQYAYNKIQGWQHPVMWDNVQGSMMLGRKPPAIAPLPELSAPEDTPIAVTLTPYESDPVDSNLNLTWSVGWWDPAAVRSISGQGSADDTLRIQPVENFFGRTNVTLVLRNSAGRTASARLNLTWTPVNDLPGVSRLDAISRRVERTKADRIIAYGGDPDDAPSLLGLELQFRPAGGSWTAASVRPEYVTNRWEMLFAPPADCPLGPADTRVRLRDAEGWGPWTEAPALLDIANAAPRVEAINASSTAVRRALPLTLLVEGQDPESPREVVSCELEIKHSDELYWSRLMGGSLDGSAWRFVFTPSARAPLGPYDVRARLSDSDGMSGAWREAWGAFSVENALPTVEALELAPAKVARGNRAAVVVRGGDVEDPRASVVCDLQYLEPSGDWARITGVEAKGDHWEASFCPGPRARLGSYSFRVILRDSNGLVSEWLYRNDSLEVVNSPPEVSGVELSAGALHRTESITLTISGRDLEDSAARMACEVEQRTEGGSWSDAFLTEPVLDPDRSVWTCTFSPPAGAPAGFYRLRARLIDGDRGWSQWREAGGRVEVLNNRPAAALPLLPQVVDEGREVSFDGSSSFDVESGLVFLWDFGDGSRAEGAEVKHIYTRGGRRVVTLTVTDADGATDRASAELRVNSLPIAIAEFRLVGESGLRVRFDPSLSSDPEGGGLSCVWDFDTSVDSDGDGFADNDADSTSTAPVHEYKRSGSYFAKLTVVDRDNGTASTTFLVKVRGPEAASSLHALSLAAGIALACAGAGAALAIRRRRRTSAPTTGAGPLPETPVATPEAVPQTPQPALPELLDSTREAPESVEALPGPPGAPPSFPETALAWPEDQGWCVQESGANPAGPQPAHQSEAGAGLSDIVSRLERMRIG
ncbi:MAG: PKD domain-containing protein [Thermoplasmatota archaeon]